MLKTTVKSVALCMLLALAGCPSHTEYCGGQQCPAGYACVRSGSQEACEPIPGGNCTMADLTSCQTMGSCDTESGITPGCVCTCPAPLTCSSSKKCVMVDGGTGPEKQGTVDYGLGSTIASARFATTTASPYTCTTTTLPSPNCSWVHCVGNLAGTPTTTADSAGTITLSGGTKTVTLTPDAMSAYPQYFDAAPAWSGGETITISAAGATVPAFSGTLLAPVPLTLTSPARDGGAFTIDRATPFALTWTGGTIGQFSITIAGPQGPSSTSIDNITCTFPAASGGGAVPVEALMKLSAGSMGTGLAISVVDKKVITAGGYAVTLQTYAKVSSTLAGAPITLK